MKKSFAFLFAIALLSVSAFSAPAYALDLASAKKQGLIGEYNSGLIGIVTSNPTPELKAFVETTNKGRMAVYQDMSTKQGISIRQVQTIAATKILEKEEPGNYIEVNGTWSVKRAQ